MVHEEFDFLRSPFGRRGTDTTYQCETIVWEETENTTRKSEETITYYYKSNESFTRKKVYFYDKRGRLINVNHFDEEHQLSTSIYSYNNHGLLIEIITNGVNYSSKIQFEYTFY